MEHEKRVFWTISNDDIRWGGYDVQYQFLSLHWDTPPNELTGDRMTEALQRVGRVYCQGQETVSSFQGKIPMRRSTLEETAQRSASQQRLSNQMLFSAAPSGKHTHDGMLRLYEQTYETTPVWTTPRRI